MTLLSFVPRTAMNDPILIDLPPAIETGRLLLRPPQAGDGAAHFDAVAESLTALRRFLSSVPWVAAEQSVGASELYCRTAQSNFLARKDLPFLMFDKASGAVLGGVGLHRTEWATPKTEVGYWCRTSKAGNGFVHEAVMALTAYAFDHVHAVRVELVTDAKNTASRRVAERCGFTLEGTLRHDRRAADGTLRDTCIYARFPEPPTPISNIDVS